LNNLIAFLNDLLIFFYYYYLNLYLQHSYFFALEFIFVMNIIFVF